MTSFEWDDAKDRVNQAKHGVPFETAQRAFRDPCRVIVPDLGHSGVERRYFCFGLVEDGMMTVRFTWRAQHPHHRRRLLAQRQDDL
ncbi:MAG TPA: BrnT family toxin [Rhizomicrobium sp.]|jgi:hypothetical protein|nr:BrnT family toxin [Rhizomicrobium sp.]